MARKQGILAKRGWSSWGDGGLGYSITIGPWKADIGPARNPENGLLEWRGVIWKGDDRNGPERQVVWADSPWGAASEVELTIEELTR